MMRRFEAFFGSGGVVLALAAAVRVVDGVHDGTTDGRTHVHVTVTTGLADHDVAVLGVAHDANGGAAGEKDAAKLAGGHAERRIAVVLTHELDGGAGGTSHRGALARLELDVVQQGTDGNLGENRAVARLDVDVLGARDDHVAHVQALGGQDVGLGAVDVVEQGDVRGAVRVVLDGRDLGRHVVLLALEVDLAVLALNAATLVTGGDAAVVVAAGLLGQGLEEGLLGLVGSDLREVGDSLPTPAGARCLQMSNCHYCFPFLSVGRCARERHADTGLPRYRAYPSCAA